MNNVILALAFFSSALVGGIAIKNTFERFADEIKNGNCSLGDQEQ